MTRAEVRRRLALEWWRWLGFALAPLFFLNLLFGDSQALGSVLEMPLFIAALASMFVSLPLFSAYKRALIATQAALDGEHERERVLGDGVRVHPRGVGHRHAAPAARLQVDVVHPGAPDGDQAQARGLLEDALGEAGVGADVDDDLRVADPADQLVLAVRAALGVDRDVAELLQARLGAGAGQGGREIVGDDDLQADQVVVSRQHQRDRFLHHAKSDPVISSTVQGGRRAGGTGDSGRGTPDHQDLHALVNDDAVRDAWAGQPSACVSSRGGSNAVTWLQIGSISHDGTAGTGALPHRERVNTLSCDCVSRAPRPSLVGARS